MTFHDIYNMVKLSAIYMHFILIFYKKSTLLLDCIALWLNVKWQCNWFGREIGCHPYFKLPNNN